MTEQLRDSTGNPPLHWAFHLVIVVAIAAAVAVLVSDDGPFTVSCWKSEHVTEQVAVRAGCLITVR